MSYEAKIFLSTERGFTETSTSQSFYTFNYHTFFNENKKAPLPLSFFNEHFLVPNSKLNIENHNGYLVVIPITGELLLHFEQQTQTVDVGELFIINADLGNFQIENICTANIHFICFGLQSSSNEFSQKLSFDFNLQSNQLINLTETINLPFRVSIGQFMGRISNSSTINETFNHQFCYIISGAFEYQNRLLQAKDGLVLYQNKEVDFEALSNYATLIVIDF